MTSSESQLSAQLREDFYDDPDKLSQLLAQAAGRNTDTQFTLSSPEKKLPAASPLEIGNLLAPPQLAPVLSPSRDFTSRRAAITPRYVKPSVLHQHSAPTTTGVLLERQPVERMYHSFADGNVMGDTQPDSQIYRNWTSGANEASKHDLGNAPSLLDRVAEEDASMTEGVKLVSSSQDRRQSPTTTNATVNLDEDDDDDDTQKRANAPLTSPLKFATPGMAGMRMDKTGQEPSSVGQTTPGTALSAAAFFPTGTSGISNSLSLTQLFNATQADTSPIVGDANEDAVFQRPSPNFVNVTRSSPGPADSSPIKRSRNDQSMRSSSEPRAEYVTMKQSQERRSRDLGEADEVPAEQDSWEEAAEIERQHAKCLAREKLEKEAARTFQRVTAPSLSSPARRKGGKLLSLSAKKLVKTPAPRKRMRMSAYDGPWDDDEPDELPQPTTVNREVSNGGDSPHDMFQGIPSAGPSPVKEIAENEDPVLVPKTSSHPHGALSGQSTHKSAPASPVQQPPRQSQVRASAEQLGRLSQRNTQGSFAIMDSQPDAAEYDSIPRPKPLLLPSSPSANQYSINNTTLGTRTGYTSQVASSSVPPMPPRSSSPILGLKQDNEAAEEDDERVPSSPPALNDGGEANEEEFVYDEHDYEEHHSAGEEDVAEREHSVDGGVDDGISESQYVRKEEAEDEEGVEVELSGPMIGDDPDDHEVPETVEVELSPYHDDEEGTTHHPHVDDRDDDAAARAFAKPRMQRQNTVPESDLMEDTQPSLFTKATFGESPQADPAPNNTGTISQIQGTDPYSTAQEHQTASPSKKDIEADTPGRPRFRSLNDIANQPETQVTDIGDIEIPNLQFATDQLDDDFADRYLGSSPTRPSAKKRRIMYSAKRRNPNPDFRSPIKNPLSGMKVSQSSPVHPRPEPQEEPMSPTAEREQRGALAAAHARSEVASAASPELTVKPPTKPKGVTPQKKGGLKLVNVQELMKKVSPKLRTTRASAAVDLSPSPSPSARKSDVEMPDGEEPVEVTTSHQTDELAPSTPQPAAPTHGVEIESVSDRGEEPTGDILLPNRVFAHWPGQGYYPATCLGSAGLHRVQVRYDDGTTNALDMLQVRSLELRQGDQVKVDSPGMKKYTYVVVGFKDKISPGQDDSAFTDSHGYKTVVLEVKQRESLPAARLDEEQPAISAPVEKLYLPNLLWNKYKDRLFTFSPPSSPNVSTPRSAAPVGMSIRQDTSTPSFTRRGTAGPSLLRESLRGGSVASSVPGPEATTFLNMAFAVSLVHDDEEELEKGSISRLITRNGGQVLDGFYELFEDIDASEPTTRPKSAQKAKAKPTSSPSASATTLALKEEHKALRFAALITDTHSRRTKYIQALALNIPCLHHRWLTDSIAAGYALPFGKYLLPAGISTFLAPDGVVRSRNVTLYDPSAEDASFEDVVNRRDLLHCDQSVLLITGKSKKEAERKKPYLFLTYALGPRTVGRCADLATAKSMIKDGDWDWVYVDGGVRGLAEAESVLFGSNTRRGSTAGAKSATKSKKRKRGSDVGASGSEVLVRVGNVGGRKVRLACDEFVIQSLILGALVEE